MDGVISCVSSASGFFHFTSHSGGSRWSMDRYVHWALHHLSAEDDKVSSVGYREFTADSLSPPLIPWEAGESESNSPGVFLQLQKPWAGDMQPIPMRHPGEGHGVAVAGPDQWGTPECSPTQSREAQHSERERGILICMCLYASAKENKTLQFQEISNPESLNFAAS